MKVIVKDLEWFEDNCDRNKYGSYQIKTEIGSFTSKMTLYCGRTIELDRHNQFDGWLFFPWMYDVVDEDDEILKETTEEIVEDMKKEIAETLKQKRKVIQISESISDGTYRNITALCDDGSVWKLNYEKDIWVKLPDIPQD